MPCDSITTTTLDLTKADLTALRAAMDSLGYTLTSGENMEQLSWLNKEGSTVRWNRQDGMIIRSRYDSDRLGDSVKEAYTGAVIQLTAKRLGWQVQKKATNQYVVTKR